MWWLVVGGGRRVTIAAIDAFTKWIQGVIQFGVTNAKANTKITITVRIKDGRVVVQDTLQQLRNGHLTTTRRLSVVVLELVL